MIIGSYLTAAFLGFIEGLTEFIPVSSTGHLLLLTDKMGFSAVPGHFFEIFIQLGAILAVAVLYWKKIWVTLVGLVPGDKTARRFALNVILATLPALVAGGLGQHWIQGHLYNPTAIAVTLIIGGIVILVFDGMFKTPKIDSIDNLPVRTAFLVGCAQAVALIPGISRSGATIMGGLALGLSRTASAELSFFLAIPVMIAAVAFDSYKNWPEITAHDGGNIGLLAVGFIVAFLTALAVLKAAMWVIVRFGFKPFGWYRIALGLLVLASVY